MIATLALLALQSPPVGCCMEQDPFISGNPPKLIGGQGPKGPHQRFLSLTWQDVTNLDRCGEFYFLLSAFSSDNGISLGACDLPLDSDPLFAASLASPDLFLPRHFGKMFDMIFYEVPPGLPAGTKVNHAFVALSSQGVIGTSNSVSFTF